MPSDLVDHRMPFFKELETQILGTIFRISILLLNLLLRYTAVACRPVYVSPLRAFHHLVMVGSIEIKKVYVSAAAEAPMMLRLVVAEDMASELVMELVAERMKSELAVELAVRFKPRYNICGFRPAELVYTW